MFSRTDYTLAAQQQLETSTHTCHVRCTLVPCLLPNFATLQVFDQVAWPAIEPVLQGVSGTVFAYGVTSRWEALCTGTLNYSDGSWPSDLSNPQGSRKGNSLACSHQENVSTLNQRSWLAAGATCHKSASLAAWCYKHKQLFIISISTSSSL